jgi:predicted RNase H-like HicB family nuclease
VRVPAKKSVCVLEWHWEDEPMRNEHLTAIIGQEDTGYVSLCPELDIASQGITVEEARANLKEAVELFFETASATEVQGRLRSDVFITRLEVAVG